MKKRLLLCTILSLALNAVAQDVYTIYPRPRQQVERGGTAALPTCVNIVAEKGIDQATLARARQVLADRGIGAAFSEKAVKGQANLLLGISGSRGAADKEAARRGLARDVFGKAKFDRHILSIGADKQGTAQILLLGENTDAAFCGLASLEQILEQAEGSLACLEIYDYADLKDRGVIEGYYGVPYSAEVTKDLFRFMARYKMNSYMYGAKSDPYHSQKWGEPYPTSITPEQKSIGYLTQDMLRDITSAAHENKVNFIWAIHPGQAFTDGENSHVLDDIMKKFGAMHALGVRQFGVFVDDVGVPDDDASLRLGAARLTELQERIDRQWNGRGALPADTVKPLHYVPQLYAFSWVSPEKGRRFFQSFRDVPAKVNIYITGRNIWSVPNSEDLAVVKGWMGREASWWWNYPCNDNDVTKLFPMDTYTNFRDEKHIADLARLEPSLQGTRTLILNPMQQGEASKIALFSAADYAWNNAAFDNQQSWENALPAVVGKKYADAFRTVAPFLRYYDSDALTYLTEDYKREHPDFPGMLLKELRKVNVACRVLEGMKRSACESDRLFYEDIRPWLLKLRDMTAEATDLMEGREPAGAAADTTLYDFPILTGLGNEISLSVKQAEPAEKVLRPFLEYLREKAAGRKQDK